MEWISSIVDAPWRAFPAAGLAFLGIGLLARGLWLGAAGRPGLLRQGRDAFAWVRCFQIALAGLTLLGVAAAWYWRQPWLLILALAILGEEMLETSRILTALANHRPRAVGTGIRRSATPAPPS